MTVLSTINRNDYTADGVQTVFAYTYLLYDVEHMRVFVDGSELESGFTVDGLENPSGGNVTFAVPPADQSVVTLLRIVPLTQLIDYVEYDPLPAEVLEKEADLDVMRAQQATEFDQRVLYYAINDVPDNGSQLPTPEAGTVIGYDQDGNLTNITLTTGGTYRQVGKDGVVLSQNRPFLNLIEGANVTITVADNSVDGRTDVTVAATGGPGGGGGIGVGTPFVVGDLLEVQDDTTDAELIRTAVRGIDGRGLQVDNIPLLDFQNSFKTSQFVDGVGALNSVIGVVETTYTDEATLSAWGGNAALSLRAGAFPNGVWFVWNTKWDQGNQANSRISLEKWDTGGGPPIETDLFEVFDDGGVVLDTAATGTRGKGTLNAKGLFIDGVPVATETPTLPLTTKGDLLTRDATQEVRFPVGADGLVLEADSSTSTGFKWGTKAPAGGGDFSGPDGAVDGNFVVFDGASGKVGRDDGLSAASFDPAGSAQDVQDNLTTHISASSIHFTVASIDHNAIANLTVGDPHTQYLNTARGDLRYLQSVNQDPAPVLGGPLQSKGSDIILTRGDDSEQGRLLALGTIEGAALAHTTEGVFDPDDGAFVVRASIAELYGSAAIVNSLTHAVPGGRQVYVDQSGTLFGVDPPPAGWVESDTDNGDYDLLTGAGLGPTVPVTGLQITVPENIEAGSRVDVSIRVYVALGTSGDPTNPNNKSSSIQFDIGVDGIAEGSWPATITLGPEFVGFVTTTFIFNPGTLITAGSTIDVFARRGVGDAGNVNPWIYGTGNPGALDHELVVSVPGSTSAPGGGGITKGTTFIQDHVMVVEDPANDGQAYTTGIPASDLQRLSASQTVSGLKNHTGGLQVAGVNVPARRYDNHTFMVLGEIDGSTTVGRHFIKLAPGEAKNLVNARVAVESGTSVGIEVTRNGTGLGANWQATAEQTPKDVTGGNIVLAENDWLSVDYTSPVGTPTIVSVTLVIESLGA